jgi:hypothetical protein
MIFVPRPAAVAATVARAAQAATACSRAGAARAGASSGRRPRRLRSSTCITPFESLSLFSPEAFLSTAAASPPHAPALLSVHSPVTPPILDATPFLGLSSLSSAPTAGVCLVPLHALCIATQTEGKSHRKRRQGPTMAAEPTHLTHCPLALFRREDRGAPRPDRPSIQPRSRARSASAAPRRRGRSSRRRRLPSPRARRRGSRGRRRAQRRAPARTTRGRRGRVRAWKSRSERASGGQRASLMPCRRRCGQ